MQGSDPPPSLRGTVQSDFVSRRTLLQFLPLKVRQWSGSVYHWLSVHPTRALPGGCLADLGSLPAAGSWPPTPPARACLGGLLSATSPGPPAGRGEGVPASRGAGHGIEGRPLLAERSVPCPHRTPAHTPSLPGE